MNGIRHTELDLADLIARGIDPESAAPREHMVACTLCLRPTWNRRALCDTHYDFDRRAVRRTEPVPPNETD